MLYSPIIQTSIAQEIKIVIDHEAYLSCKKGYCSNEGIALIQLHLADLSKFC